MKLIASRSVLLMVALGIGFAPFLSGCQIGYVFNQARHQVSLLASREPISEVLADPKTTSAERAKLELTLKVRDAAPTLGFQPKKLYSQYARVDSPALTWVLMATKANSFTLKTWWFPIVGTVPYKGFFREEDAHQAAAELAADGYETSVRGSIAFSSLGWFNDPVVSTMIPMNDWNFVATLFHELTHATTWIPGKVSFNETLAEAIGIYAAGDFFKDDLGAQKRIELSKDLELATTEIQTRLEALYAQEQDTQKLTDARKQIWDEVLTPVRAKYEGFQALKTPNNPELLQLSTYLTGFGRISKVVGERRKNWSGLWGSLGNIVAACESSELCDPIGLLETSSAVN